MTQLRADVFRSSPPVLMVEIPEIALPFLFFVEIAKRNVEPHGSIAERWGIEHSGLDFQAWVKADRPLDDVSARTLPGFGDTVLRMGFNPGLVPVPGIGGAAGFAL